MLDLLSSDLKGIKQYYSLQALRDPMSYRSSEYNYANHVHKTKEDVNLGISTKKREIEIEIKRFYSQISILSPMYITEGTPSEEHQDSASHMPPTYHFEMHSSEIFLDIARRYLPWDSLLVPGHNNGWNPRTYPGWHN